MVGSEASREGSLPAVTRDLTEEERRVHRLSQAGTFDQLLGVTLKLVTEVRRLVFVSYAMILISAISIIVTLWRR